MALRVLLADESSTIKKVMQLALQDFAVEVKAVHVGIDVLEVARAFKPDVIFVDVLLQKRSGYEVCAELKAEASTRHTPTILMWSSFMELDQDQLAKAQPTAKIEKPFDVETLRKLVLSVVPETRSQRLSHFLEFPESVDESARQDANLHEAATRAGRTTTVATTTAPIPMPPPIQNSRANFPIPTDQVPVPPPTPGQSKANIQVPPPAAAAAPKGSAKDSWTMESFDDINEFAANEPVATDEELGRDLAADADEDFQPMNLSKSQANVPSDLALEPVEEPVVEEAWSHKDLSRFKVDLPPVSVEDGGIDLEIDMAEDEFTSSGFLYRPDHGQRNTPVVIDEPVAPPEALELDANIEEPELEERTQPILEVEDNTARLQLEREEIAQPLEPMEARSTQGSYRIGWTSRADNADIPQLSADHIEQIIRAQSRDIIEEVVRRVVPDIATQLIREELDRLLEETSVRETRRREPRP